MRTVDVLVVGAGPTGLALAIDLVRRGIQTALVERGAGLVAGSRGKGLQPRTMEVLEDLGVLEDVRAAGRPYPVGMIWKDGIRQGEHRMFDDREPTEAEPYQGPWMLPQWRTQEILLARLRDLGGEVLFEREVVGIEQNDDRVIATFASGPDVHARYVVATDGGRSTVRQLLGIGMTGESVDPHPMLVADVCIPSLDRDYWHVFPPRGDREGFLALCPLPGTSDLQLVAQFSEGTTIDLSTEGVRALVATRSHIAAVDVAACAAPPTSGFGRRSPTASALAASSLLATRRTSTHPPAVRV